MNMMRQSRRFRVAAAVLAAGCLSARAQGTAATASAPSAPDDRPARDIVIVKVGPVLITQADLDEATRGMRPETWAARRDAIITNLVNDAHLDLYLKDHPERVSEEQANQRIDQDLAARNAGTRQELQQRVIASGRSWEDYLRHVRRLVLLDLIAKEADERSRDPETVRKLWEERRQDFDGSKVQLRQIMLRAPVYWPPQRREQKRLQLEQIREDLLAGRRTWDECVTESESARKHAGGSLGWVGRHEDMAERLMREVFYLPVGELSEVIDGGDGFHLYKVTDRMAASEHKQPDQRRIAAGLRREITIAMGDELRAKYPVIGVEEPRTPAFLAAPATRPSATSPAATSPSGTPADSSPAP